MRKKIFNFVLILLIFIFTLNISNTYCANNEAQNLNIYSDSAILIDYKTGTTLYSKNSDVKMYPASTTKILTAILAIENCNLDDIVTVSNTDILSIPAGYSSANLVIGEQISVKDLLSVFLVHSANDAGFVLADHISGSISEFANLMNKKASDIGCKNTHFTNPSGIHDENHYTTSYDLALIAKYCMQNSTFRDIVSSKNCTINSTNKSGVRSFINTNDLINPSSKYYLKECIGIKTGYTTQAKNCLISACVKNNIALISVVLGANKLSSGESSRYEDSINLFNYGFSNYSLKTLAKKSDVATSLNVINGSKDTKNLNLVLKNDLSCFVNNNDIIKDPTITLNEKILAPISKGTVLGTITYNINNTSYSEDLIAEHDVSPNDYTFFLLLIGLGFLIILIIAIVLILFFKTKKNIEF